jgi:HEAT repeat protein
MIGFLANAPSLLLLLLGALLAPGSSDLRSELARLEASQGGPTWLGYAVPMVAGGHHLCGEKDVVRLEDEDGEHRDRSWMRESPEAALADLFVLYRVEGGRVTRILSVSSECRIDAGTRTLHRLDTVSSAESLGELAAVVSKANGDRVAEQAIHAIALHRDPDANETLAKIAAGGSSRGVRKAAVFWLGALRGEGGLPILSSRLEAEEDGALREQIVFALNLSSAEGATGKLVETARGDRDARIRSRALFWLSQKAGKHAASTIASAVREDPEVEVKKQAVFALSQLPADEGIPLLIEVAETHPSREVRKQAFFWLGQSHDPRALALFERILLEK